MATDKACDLYVLSVVNTIHQGLTDWGGGSVWFMQYGKYIHPPTGTIKNFNQFSVTGFW